MAITLKLVAEEIDEIMVQTLKLVRDNNNSNIVNIATANKEGFTIEEATYERMKTLVLLGQRYEEISKSQKQEFTDL